MEFINEQGTYDCEKLKNPELYTAFQGQFEEQIDVTLCKMIVIPPSVVVLDEDIVKLGKITTSNPIQVLQRFLVI